MRKSTRVRTEALPKLLDYRTNHRKNQPQRASGVRYFFLIVSEEKSSDDDDDDVSRAKLVFFPPNRCTAKGTCWAADDMPERFLVTP